MPEVPRVQQRRLDPVEQNVLIFSPTLQAPKRRINYTGIRSPAKQIRQEIEEEIQVFKFRCNLCPMVEFPDKEGLTQHLNSFHTGDNRHYCKFCTRRFQIKANYENHLELDHGRDKFGRELPKKQTAPKPHTQRIPQAKKPPTIRVGTSRQVILTDTLHDPSVDVIIDTADTAEDRKQAQDKIQQAYQAWLNKRESEGAEAVDKKCICPICNVTMANKYKLEKHMQGHANPKKVMPKVRKCYHCDRVFQEGLQLERHVDAYHTHRCPKCDRVFNNLGDRDLHLVVAHARKKTGRKSEIIEEEELEPEVPLEANVTPRPRGRVASKPTPSAKSTQKPTPSAKSTQKSTPAKSAQKSTPPAKSAQKTASSRKRAASPEPRPKMTPKKLKVQLIHKKKGRGRPKKVVAVKGKAAKKAQPAKKAAQPAKKAAQPAKKSQPAKKVQSAKSTPKGKGKSSPKKNTVAKKASGSAKKSPKKATPKKTPQKASSRKASPKAKPPPRKAAAKTPAKSSGKKLNRSDSLERKSPRKPHPKRMPEGFVMTGSEWKVALKVKDSNKTGAKSKSAQRKSPAAQKRAQGKGATKKTAPKKVVSKKVKATTSKGQKLQPKKAQTATKKTAAKSSKATPAKKSVQSSTSAVPVRKSKTGRQVFKVEGRSAVWEYFGFYMSGSQYLKDVAVCLLCGEEKGYYSDGSTARMRGHIQHQHSDIWSKKFQTPKKSGKKK